MNSEVNKIEYHKELDQAILSTVVYFDIFDYPLTISEIWKWLYVKDSIGKYNISEILDRLENNYNLNEKISFKNVFYFLKGREDIINIRHRRHLIAIPKWRKARRVTKILRIIPYLYNISACNKIAYYNAENNSDIDFFIITKKGRIWMTRFFVTLITSILGVRRQKNKIANRICLSFYITENHYDLSRLTIEDPDIHFIYWFSQISQIYDRQASYKKLINKNSWIKKYLPNFTYFKGVEYERKVKDIKILAEIREYFEKVLDSRVGDYIENKIKNYQIKKMDKNLESARWQQNTNVMISDDILKFHEKDTRTKVKAEFYKRIKELGLDY